MTSTHVGLPDRYRPLDEVGPVENTPTGVIHTWRAKDRVLNRDVAIRVHTPGGPPAHAWIARALTAGGLATPALAMVYDASEGSDDPQADGGAAYVVNEWIDGETLAERLTRGPVPEREARTVLRRLAEGVAEAHRVGLPVGGLTPENVVLRPNGLVGLRGVPAATGTVAGDITALGALLEVCLTGTGDAARDPRRPAIAPDLAALVRRARSTEPGQGLSSVAAMASLLGERPRGATRMPDPGLARSGGGGATRPEMARPDAARGEQVAERPADQTRAVDAPVRDERPAEAPARPVAPVDVPTVAPTIAVPPPVRQEVTQDAGWDDRYPDRYADEWSDEWSDGPAGGFVDDELHDADFDDDGGDPPSTRRRLLVLGLPLVALALVIGLAIWFGSNVLSVAGSVDEGRPTAPIPTTPTTAAPTTSAAPALGTPLSIASAAVFDPYGDKESENARRVPLAHDGDPATVWATLRYKGSAHFGNLKPGVGILFDLGSPQPVGGVTLTTTQPGSTVEVRTGATGDGALDAYTVAGTATLDPTTQVRFPRAVTSRYVLVWFTGLVPDSGSFSANLAEVAVLRAG
jgi:serine/threonine protein kinase